MPNPLTRTTRFKSPSTRVFQNTVSTSRHRVLSRNTGLVHSTPGVRDRLPNTLPRVSEKFMPDSCRQPPGNAKPSIAFNRCMVPQVTIVLVPLSIGGQIRPLISPISQFRHWRYDLKYSDRVPTTYSHHPPLPPVWPSSTNMLYGLDKK